MKKILISGYYGFGNSGDDALLLSIIRDFDRKGLKKYVTVLSANPKETKRVYGVNAVNRLNPFALVYHLITARLFISGGGTLIQDGTSTKSLLYYLYLIKVAKMLGKKVMLYANGIGPVIREKNKVRVKKILNKVNCITVRDEKSMDELKILGITKPETVLTADPAFLLDAEANIEKLKKKYSLEDIVCTSVRVPKNGDDKFAAGVAKALDNVSEKYGAKAVILPFQDADKEVSEKIASLMENEAIVVSEKLTVGQTLSMVGISQMCIGMRLHMLIYAASKGIPIVGIVYDPKVSGFMEYCNQDLFVDVKSVNEENLTELVDKCYSEREKRCGELAEVRERLRERAALNSEIALRLYEKEN